MMRNYSPWTFLLEVRTESVMSARFWIQVQRSLLDPVTQLVQDQSITPHHVVPEEMGKY
jgi:hypothetical protein